MYNNVLIVGISMIFKALKLIRNTHKLSLCAQIPHFVKTIYKHYGPHFTESQVNPGIGVGIGKNYNGGSLTTT